MKNSNRKVRSVKRENRVFVALYRGINVGGRNPVKMAALCALHERLGHTGVRHYIQSGNIVFSADGSPGVVAHNLVAGFAGGFGFGAKIMILTAEELAQIVEENPYGKSAAADPKSVHAGICDGEPSAEALVTLLKKCGGPESFTVRGRVVYLHAPDGVGQSKFAAGWEKACGVPMTARNWRTIEKLRAMIGE